MLTEANLHKYQKACVEHIINNPYCGLFLDMGLGKTVSTLTAINYLMFDYLEISNVLVIAPKRVASSVWAEEAQKWEHLRHLKIVKLIGSPQERLAGLQQRADIYIIGRDNLTWLCALYGGGKLPFDMIVADELSSFKSYKSQRFKSLQPARLYLKRFVGLTGTPAPNGLIDLWPQIWLMDRGDRLEKTISCYRDKYFKPGKMNGHVVFRYDLLAESEKLIHEKIADICISMKSEDYLEMPDLTNNFIKLYLPSDLQKKYIEFEREKIFELTEAGVEVNAINAAGLSNKLLQFANGAIYDEHRDTHEVHNIKLEALKEIIEDAQGQPVLVAWSYKFDRNRIMEYLKAYKPRELKTNKDIDDWNAGKVQVMLAHPASAGHGLNLQAGGSIIVWFGLTWSLELYQQFNGRLYRQGQQKKVIIHHLVMAKTHDEDVIHAIQYKNRKQNSLLESIKAKIEKYKQQ